MAFERLMMAGVAAVYAGVAPCGELPGLIGDGVADDTAAIQARLDAGEACVYLPPPKKCYLISKTLRIGSETELRLDRFSVIRLAPKSDCPMIENRGYVGGKDVRVAITGGVWDMANLDQSPNPGAFWWYSPARPNPFPERHDPAFFMGMAMRFCNVENMTVRGVTVRNPTTYGMAFCKASYFLVDDITFDYRTFNPCEANLDGVHLDGCCHHGRISNLRGTCYDDMVALNANDEVCAPEEGQISDIVVDGLYADYCHSAVRMLSAPSEVRRIVVRNVHGRFFTYAVGLTHYFPKRPRGRFDDIVIEDLFASKDFAPESFGKMSRARYSPVFIEGPVDVGTLTVSRLVRDETAVPTPTVTVGPEASVGNLVVRDCKMRNRLREPAAFFGLGGRVGHLTVEGLDLGENCVDGRADRPDDVVPDPVIDYLAEISLRHARAGRFLMKDGTAAYPPQARKGYNAFFLRDYAYILEGCADELPRQEMLDAARLFVRGINERGEGVDSVFANGEFNYKPGAGRVGDHAVSDGTAFTVDVVYLTWKATGDAALLGPDVLDRLVFAMRNGVPRNGANGLVRIEPKQGPIDARTKLDRAPYGFTDVVRKQGDVLFTSLLDFEASKRLAELLSAAGRAPEAAEWTSHAARVKGSLNAELWNEGTGLYDAASVTCRQGDVWGSAFAVWLGIPDGCRAYRIACVLRDNYTGLVQNGQVRHLLPGEYWEVADAALDTYQNGGYWGTPTGWVVFALVRLDAGLARKTVDDLVSYYKAEGVPEWSFCGKGRGFNQLDGYLSSSTLPLAVFRKMKTRSDWR